MRGLSRNASETLDLSIPRARARSAMVTRFFCGSKRTAVLAVLAVLADELVRLSVPGACTAPRDFLRGLAIRLGVYHVSRRRKRCVAAPPVTRRKSQARSDSGSLSQHKRSRLRERE